MNKKIYKFEDVIENIEEFELGTKIRSETGDTYNLSQAEGIGKQRKFSRWNGTKLRFMSYENIGKSFEILGDNTKEIEEMDIYDDILDYDYRDIEINRRKINELIEAVNQIKREMRKE